jgi:hypothetical protein
VLSLIATYRVMVVCVVTCSCVNLGWRRSSSDTNDGVSRAALRVGQVIFLILTYMFQS